MDLQKLAAVTGILGFLLAVIIFFKPNDPGPEEIKWGRVIKKSNTHFYKCTWNNNEIGKWHDCRREGTCGDKPKILTHCKLEYEAEALKSLRRH